MTRTSQRLFRSLPVWNVYAVQDIIPLRFVYVCQRLTSSLTSLNAVAAETMRGPCVLQFTLMI